jgi:tRNA(Glu) U13 pseudouridine synthase TruD
MYIHSVQSAIFNDALCEILSSNADSLKLAKNELEYSLGKLIFYENNSEYQKINTKQLELIGFNTLNMHTTIKYFLNKYSLTPREFIIRAIPELSVEGTTRECLVEIENLEIIIQDTTITEENIYPNKVKTAIISFELSKGSYATIAIKALLNSKNITP